MSDFDERSAVQLQSDLDSLSRKEREALIRSWLDSKDIAVHRAFWERLSSRPLRVGNWVFVADPGKVEAILGNTDFKVTEYDRRMRAASGRFYLGLDGSEHDTEAKTGAVIPAWNTYATAASAPIGVYAQKLLRAVRDVAEQATLKSLESLSRRVEITRIADPEDLADFAFNEILGAVLDACSAEFFGVPGPSSLSLIMWAKDITWYNFRVHANQAEDRSCAIHSSALFRGHILSLMEQAAPLIDPADPADARDDRKRRAATLFKSIQRTRTLLEENSLPASDDDVARTLMGIISGSLTATAKGFVEALSEIAREHDNDQLVLDVVCNGATHEPENEQASIAGEALFPRYTRHIAGRLAQLKRGSLDSIYREYVGAAPFPAGENVFIENGDLVVVWLGGTLAKNQDNLFGIGVHACPGKDMAKATIEGMLSVFEALRDVPIRLFKKDEAYYCAMPKDLAKFSAAIASHPAA